MRNSAPNGFVFFLAVTGMAASAPADAATPTTRSKVLPVIQTASPPPVLMVPPPSPMAPPPPPVMQDSAEQISRMQRAMQEIVTLDVEVTGAGERLWLGSLRVNSSQSGEYNSTLRQANNQCSSQPASQMYDAQQQNQLSVSFQRRNWDRDIDGFYIRTSWGHPRLECDGGGGQRTVSFDQRFSLRPGETRQLTGDGGLTVKVTRRP